ncbi:MAG: alpha-L-fucosidase [Prevotellaceae bacterium]|jgi:alpha-L-fucosidase|nr:alpha-L-fucosidase [Prevotellaceae bacterium]
MKRIILIAALCALFHACRMPVAPPAPYGPVPTTAQLEWQKMEYYMFVHFGPNTFTDMEWGDGREDPQVFRPIALDCRQWAETAVNAGMKGIIITAKHHDGFCLWPSRYSTHTVRESGWREGRGDVLRELSDACRTAGLKFGVYLSPWDRNHPTYGTPDYNEVFTAMLAEVLTGYGAVFEQWFDGANGEGDNGKRQVYDWPLFHRTVYHYQPSAVIFSDVGPGCRWIGNEDGRAGETNWSRLDTTGFEPGKIPVLDTLTIGNIYGQAWIPAETDVSIRPGWFYSPATDDKVKPTDELRAIYYTSVGRNSNLLLNVPPDRNGRIHPHDSTRLMDFRAAIEADFRHNLAAGATITANNIRGDSPRYSAVHLLDADFDTYWATDDTATTATLEITLPAPQTFSRLLLQEYIPLGQRIAAVDVDYWDDTSHTWMSLASATTIGYKRILQFPATTSDKLRIHIRRSLACPTLSTVGVY